MAGSWSLWAPTPTVDPPLFVFDPIWPLQDIKICGFQIRVGIVVHTSWGQCTGAACACLVSEHTTAVLSCKLAEASTHRPKGPTLPLTSAPLMTHNLSASLAYAGSNGSAIARLELDSSKLTSRSAYHMSSNIYNRVQVLGLVKSHIDPLLYLKLVLGLLKSII